MCTAQDDLCRFWKKNKLFTSKPRTDCPEKNQKSLKRWMMLIYPSTVLTWRLYSCWWIGISYIGNIHPNRGVQTTNQYSQSNVFFPIAMFHCWRLDMSTLNRWSQEATEAKRWVSSPYRWSKFQLSHETEETIGNHRKNGDLSNINGSRMGISC